MGRKPALLIASLCLGLSWMSCSRMKGCGSVLNDHGPNGLIHGRGSPGKQDGGEIFEILADGSDGPGGSTGDNGLDPDAYRTYQKDLKARMSDRLVTSPGGSTLSVEFDKRILNDPMDAGKEQARRLVAYTLDCAVSSGLTDFVSSTEGPFPSSKGILLTTSDWRDGGLTKEAQEDLHTCLATRLNPNKEIVTIWVGGKNVKNKESSAGYAVREAYWAARIRDPQLPIEIDVWPLKPLKASCSERSGVPGGVYTLLSKRICGSLAGALSCNLNLRDDEADCVGDGGFFMCHRDPPDGGILGPPTQVVIETRMKCSDWCTVYPECSRPPECDAGTSPCSDGGGLSPHP